MLVEALHPPRNAAQQLAVEQTLFDSPAIAQTCLRIWQPLPALIATTAESNLPSFAAAAAHAADHGLPVYVRRTGGGAVCLGPGMLVVTHLYATRKNDIDHSYRQFTAALIKAIGSLGVALADEHVASAYCNGRFDLAWHGLKVGGIAQRRRLTGGMDNVWIHAAIAVEDRCLRYPEAVATFYSNVGSPRIADPRSATTLSACLPPGTSAADLLARCARAITGEFRDVAGATPTWDRRNPRKSAV